MTDKKRLMKDLKFCQELMNRLVAYSDENFHDGHTWGSNRTVIQTDIIRLRRELNNVKNTLEERY